MQKSIFNSALRSFLVTLFAMFGIAFGMIPLMLTLIWLLTTSEDKMDIESQYAPTIVSNAEGVRKKISSTAPVILKINMEGFIGSEKFNMHTVHQQLIESREGHFKDGRVKALLLHLNTPGGTVADADGIYRAIKAYKEHYKVPVFAFVDGMCASGGMYIAAAADKIYATDASLVGSVGVLLNPFFNLSKLMEKIGVESLTLSAGKGKDDMNPFRPWKSGEDEPYKMIVDYYYNHFVDVVTSNRPEVNRSRLISDYGARIFPAEKALDMGFIDGSGYSFNDTLRLLAKQIGIQDDYYQVVKMEKTISLGDLFRSDSVMMTGIVKHQLELPLELDSKQMNQFLYLYLPGR
ncbi:MAG TPA: S49 family peptidase [Waddliaceae bacterium]